MNANQPKSPPVLFDADGLAADIMYHRVTDPAVLRHLDRTDDPPATIDRLLSVGAQVMDHAAGSAAVDLLEARARQVEASLARTAGEINDRTRVLVEELASTTRDHVARAAATIDPTVDGTAGAKLAATLHRDLERRSAALHKSIAESHRSDVGAVRGEVAALRQGLTELRDLLITEQTTQVAQAATPLHGHTWEDTVAQHLQQVCLLFGDNVRDVAREVDPVSHRKVVDLIAQIRNSSVAVGIEARSASMSRPALDRVVEQGLQARAVSQVIVVVDDPARVPRGLAPLSQLAGGWLVVLDPQDPTLFGVVYRLARIAALADLDTNTTATSAEQVRVAMGHIRTRVDSLRSIERNATRIEKSVTQGASAIRADSRQIRGDILSILADLEAGTGGTETEISAA